MTFTPVQKLSIGTGVSLVLLALVGLAAYSNIGQVVGGQRSVAATNRNIAQLDRLIARTLDGENAERGFLSTGDTAYLEPLNDAQSDVEFALDSLRVATEDNPLQRRTLDSLAPMLSSRFREIRGAVAARRRGADSARRMLRADRALRANAGAGTLAGRMRDEEFRVLGERTRNVTARSTFASRAILVCSVLALVLSLVALQPGLRPKVADRLEKRLAGTKRKSQPVSLTVTEEARHAGDRLTRLQQVIAALSVPVSDADVAQAILSRGAPPLVGSLGVVVMEYSGELHVLHSAGDTVRHLAPGMIVPSTLATPFIDAMNDGEAVFVESRIDRNARYAGLGRFSESGTSDGAFVVTPLRAGDQVLGAFLLAFADNRTFSVDDRDYLETLGRIGGQALLRGDEEIRRLA